jgi:excisionase family DNA binding protein
MNMLLRSHGMLSVAESAAILGVTPQAVRDLIAAGELDAQRIGRMFVVPRSGVELLARAPRPVGRPLAPATAWQLIAVLSGRSPDSVGTARPGRLLEQLCRRTAAEMASRLRVRARPQHLALTTGTWRRLLEDPRVVPSAAGLSLTLDAYVAAEALPAVVERYGLRPIGDEQPRASFVLRVVPRSVPAALAPRRPRTSEAAQLLDAFDSADADRHSEGSRGFARLWQARCAVLAP